MKKLMLVFVFILLIGCSTVKEPVQEDSKIMEESVKEPIVEEVETEEIVEDIPEVVVDEIITPKDACLAYCKFGESSLLLNKETKFQECYCQLPGEDVLRLIVYSQKANGEAVKESEKRIINLNEVSDKNLPWVFD